MRQINRRMQSQTKDLFYLLSAHFNTLNVLCVHWSAPTLPIFLLSLTVLTWLLCAWALRKLLVRRAHEIWERAWKQIWVNEILRPLFFPLSLGHENNSPLRKCPSVACGNIVDAFKLNLRCAQPKCEIEHAHTFPSINVKASSSSTKVSWSK